MDTLAVTELRQWAYCRRVVYYHQIMPGAGQNTYKMREGERAQEMIESLEMRRTLREYGLEAAERQFGVWLNDERIGLSGKIDLLLKGEGFASVVDFKLTSGEVGENHRMQLAGYAALVESALGLPGSCLYDSAYAGDRGTTGTDGSARAMRGMRICELLRRRLVSLADWRHFGAVFRSAGMSLAWLRIKSLKCAGCRAVTVVSPSRRGLKFAVVNSSEAVQVSNCSVPFAKGTEMPIRPLWTTSRPRVAVVSPSRRGLK